MGGAKTICTFADGLQDQRGHLLEAAHGQREVRRALAVAAEVKGLAPRDQARVDEVQVACRNNGASVSVTGMLLQTSRSTWLVSACKSPCKGVCELLELLLPSTG